MTVTADELKQAWGIAGSNAAPSSPAGAAAGGAPTDMMGDADQKAAAGNGPLGPSGPSSPPSLPLKPAGPKNTSPQGQPVTGDQLARVWGPTMKDTDTTAHTDPTTAKPAFEQNHPWGAAFLRAGLNLAQGLEGAYRGSMGDQITVKRGQDGKPILDANGNPELAIPEDKEQFYLEDLKQRYAAMPKTLGGEIEDFIEKFIGGLGMPIPGAAVEGLENPAAVSPDMKLSRILRASGAKINPVEDPEAGLVRKSVQMAAGKLKTDQYTSLKNIEWSDNMIRKHFRLEESTPITAATMDAIIDGAGESYARGRAVPAWQTDPEQLEAAKQFGQKFLTMVAAHPKLYDQGLIRRVHELRSVLMDPNWDGDSAMDAIKTLHAAARKSLTGGTLAPMDWLQGGFEKDAAGVIEQALGRAAARNGDAQLIDRIQTARVTIAQAYDVRSAILGDHVNPAMLARLQRLSMSRAGRSAGRAPLSGAPRLIADGALRFPRSFLSASEAKPMKVGDVGSLMQMTIWAGFGMHEYGLLTLFLGRVAAQGAVRSGAAYLNPLSSTKIMENALSIARGIAKANPVALTIAAGGASASPQTWPMDPLIALFSPIVGREDAAQIARGSVTGAAAWGLIQNLKSRSPEGAKTMFEAQEFVDEGKDQKPYGSDNSQQ